MRKVLILLVALVATAGCKKALDVSPGKDEKPTIIPNRSSAGGGGMGGVHAPTNVVIDPSAAMSGGATRPAPPQPVASPPAGGQNRSAGVRPPAPGQNPSGPRPPVRAGSGSIAGGGGAIQNIRKAVGRTVTLNELNNLRLFVDTASLASGRMPTEQEILAAVQQDDPNLARSIREGAIVLTNARTRESIWAFTKEPLRGGQHYAVTNSGIEQMTPEQLQQRLAQQR